MDTKGGTHAYLGRACSTSVVLASASTTATAASTATVVVVIAASTAATAVAVTASHTHDGGAQLPTLQSVFPCCLGCVDLVKRTPAILLPRSASDGSLVVAWRCLLALARSVFATTRLVARRSSCCRRYGRSSMATSFSRYSLFGWRRSSWRRSWHSLLLYFAACSSRRCSSMLLLVVDVACLRYRLVHLLLLFSRRTS